MDDNPNEGWDCDPFAQVIVEPYDLELDIEDDEGDWQVLALDRFGDRNVNPGNYNVDSHLTFG